jgi:hypothetical protein
MILRSSTYTYMIQNLVENRLMETQGQSSLFVYPFNLRNSLNRLYHIRPDYFKPYNDFCNLMQYMLRFALLSGIRIPSGTFMYISESSDPYKYAVITSINCIDRWFCTANEIKYRNVIPLMTGEYVSLKSTPGLCVKPCATSLALYLITSLFSFLLRMKTHLYLTGRIPGGIGLTAENTFLLFSEAISTSIASFHLS